MSFPPYLNLLFFFFFIDPPASPGGAYSNRTHALPHAPTLIVTSWGLPAAIATPASRVRACATAKSRTPGNARHGGISTNTHFQYSILISNIHMHTTKSFAVFMFGVVRV